MILSLSFCSVATAKVLWVLTCLDGQGILQVPVTTTGLRLVYRAVAFTRTDCNYFVCVCVPPIMLHSSEIKNGCTLWSPEYL